MACAAANVVLDVVPRDDFLANVRRVGEHFKNRLVELKNKYPDLIKEVRGEGLILGAELNIEGRPIVNDVLQAGAIINCTVGKVLRFIPPLIITAKDVDEVIEKIDGVLPKYAERG